jgi:hypothetical protein
MLPEDKLCYLETNYVASSQAILHTDCVMVQQICPVSES